MRPLFKKLAPAFLGSYLSRNTGAHTGTSKLYDEGSKMRSHPRTQQEVLEDMDREVDRQLMEFEMTRHLKSEKRTSTAGLVFPDAKDRIGEAV